MGCHCLLLLNRITETTYIDLPFQECSRELQWIHPSLGHDPADKDVYAILLSDGCQWRPIACTSWNFAMLFASNYLVIIPYVDFILQFLRPDLSCILKVYTH